MPVQDKKFQTVFLIDVEDLKSNHTEEKSHHHLAQSIILSAFRILYFFQSQSKYFNCDVADRKFDNVKWSFKFFDSSSYKVSKGQHNLREFKLRHFKDLETEVDNFLLQPTTECSKKDSSKSSKALCPAENLSRALKEIIYDFQWETPEFVSPMKGRKNQPQQLTLKSSNSVFLFSGIPKDSQALRRFCGKKVIDDEVFMDSFMSSSLFDMFHNLSKLSLFWIDTDFQQFFHDHNTQDIVSKSLKKIGGCYISVHSLVHIPLSKFTSNLDRGSDLGRQNNAEDSHHNKATKQSKNTNISCIFNDFVGNLPTQTVLSQKIDHKELSSETKIEACINFIDGNNCFTVPVLLSLTDQATEKLRNDSEVNGCEEDKEISFSLCSDIHAQSKQTMNNITLKLVKTDKEITGIPNQFLAVGCTKSFSADYSHLEITQTFLCHGLHNGDSALQPSLINIISDLMKEKTNMVIMSTGALPYLGLLEPVNNNGAMLTLYQIGSKLQVEKALYQNIYEKSCDTSENSHTESIPIPLSSKQISALGHQFNLHSNGKKSGGLSKNKVKKYNPQVLDKWHLPGTSQGMQSIVLKLNQRLSELEFLDSKEKATLKKLQKFYRKQNLPPKLEDLNPPREFQHIDENAMSAEDMKLSTTNDGGLSLRRQSSSTTLSRTDIILNRSKHVQKRQSTETLTSSQIVNDNKSHVDVANIDLQTDDDVCNYVKDTYKQCLDNDSNMESTIRTLVTVVLHYMKSNNRTKPEESCKSLINDAIKSSNMKLREKYQAKTTDQDKQEKMIEYKLQILLVLELESVIMSDDDNNLEESADEVVNMLRTVSFIYDQSVVPKFLNEVIVPNYSATLPKLLISVYDELMQPLPQELAGFASPNTSGDISLNHSVTSQNDSAVFQEPSSNTSNHSDILLSQPARRSRRVVHHPSLSNFGSKKQIMVALDSKPKPPKEKKEKSRRTISKPSKVKPKQEEAVKVRRNLFEGEKPKLERRQSVAVMESVRRSPRKHHTSSFKNPAGSKSPGKRLVAETPSHKQKSNHVWRQQERKRRRTQSKDGVMVVEESPMKPCAAQEESEPEVKASPGRFRKKAGVSRRSFYSASSTRTRPRNLSAYYNLGDRIAGRHRTSSQTEEKLNQSLSQLAKTSPCKKFMSPTRRSRSFLMSQLMSPSPTKNISSTITSPSQRTRSKTPKKTPSRILFESPKRRVNSPSKLVGVVIPCSPHGKTPKKQTFHPLRAATTPQNKTSQTKTLVFDTPEKATQSKLLDTPPKHTPKRSPRLRNKENKDIEKPQVTVTPKSKKYEASTPGKSPSRKYGVGTLDEEQLPSKTSNQDTHYQTPTKTPKSNSARKSLMKDSPFRNTRSHGAATPTRNSVCTALFTTSPPRTFVSPQAQPTANDSTVFKTPSKTFKLKSPPSAQKKTLFSPLKNISERISKVENISPDKPTYIIRTPSPHDKRTKTPESLDKWPRVKRPRDSPGTKLDPVSRCHKPCLADVIEDNSVCDPVILQSKTKNKRVNSDDEECDLSLPNKRQRFDDHESNNKAELTGKGYFSNINNDVFIKQPDEYDREPCKSVRGQSPVFGSSPLRKKMKEKKTKEKNFMTGFTDMFGGLSQESNQSTSTLSDVSVPFQSVSNSPVLKTKKVQVISPVSKATSVLNTPKEKKFSPSISSKSLVQLMNSPLLQSNNKDQSHFIKSPKKANFKSRKSLNLGD